MGEYDHLVASLKIDEDSYKYYNIPGLNDPRYGKLIITICSNVKLWPTFFHYQYGLISEPTGDWK